MKFTVEEFNVEVIAGRPEVCYFNDGNGNYNKVQFGAPESLIHPAFKEEFSQYVLKCIKMHNQKLLLSKRAIDQGLMRYVPPKVIRSGYSAYTFRKMIEERVKDIDKAKEEWDYNKAPSYLEKPKGKFGDLKSFLESRKGTKLNLTGE